MANYKYNLTDVLGRDWSGKELRRGDFIAYGGYGEIAMAIVRRDTVARRQDTGETINAIEVAIVLSGNLRNSTIRLPESVFKVDEEIAVSKLTAAKLNDWARVRPAGLKFLETIRRQRKKEGATVQDEKQD